MRDLGKLIVAKGFKKLPKVQKIAQSGHTARDLGWKHLGTYSIKLYRSINCTFIIMVKFDCQIILQWKNPIGLMDK